MYEIFAGIYNTNGDGMDKVASSNGQPIATLSDLALELAAQGLGEDSSPEKVAEVHEQIFAELCEADIAGRAIAQSEFSALEKQAAEGDTSGIEMFFAEEDEMFSDISEEQAAELRRRGLL